MLRGLLPALFRDRDGRARRRRAARRHRSPRRWRSSAGRLRAAAGPDADASGDQRQPRRPHRRVALRPADRSRRAAARDGPSRGSDAHQRSHRRARFRSRHDRSAAVDLDGLHRRRARRADRRPRLRRSSSPRTRGGRRCCSAARGSRRTGCCARARSGATATPTRCAPRSATPTTRIGSPSIRRPAKELRLFGLPDWTIERFIERRTRAARRCSTKRRGCASGRWCGACCSSSAANVARVLVARARGVPTGRLTLGEVVVFAQARSARR